MSSSMILFQMTRNKDRFAALVDEVVHLLAVGFDDGDDGGSGVDVAHDQGHGGFGADGGRGDVVVAGGGVFDEALETEDAEASPAGGEVGFGYFCHTGERHDFIIRFGVHVHWIRDGL